MKEEESHSSHSSHAQASLIIPPFTTATTPIQFSKYEYMWVNERRGQVLGMVVNVEMSLFFLLIVFSHLQVLRD